MTEKEKKINESTLSPLQEIFRNIHEFNAKIAIEIMEYKIIPWTNELGELMVPQDFRYKPEEIRFKNREKDNPYVLVPYYDRNLDEAHEVEEKIKDLGLIEEYLNNLENIVPKGTSQAENIFLLVTASAKDRCKAALKAVEMNNEHQR